MEVLFGLITAVAFRFNYYFIRKGLRTDPHSMLAAFVTLSVNFFFFLVLFYCYVPSGLL